MGCHVTAISHSPAKVDEAKRFGAHDFVSASAPGALQAHAGTCDLLLSTVSADIPWKDYLAVLKPGGKLAILGVPSHDVQFAALPLILARQSIVMSPVGSRSEIKAMLDFSARHRIVPQVEVFPMSEVNKVLERLGSNQMRYRAVLATPS
jgi:alcohol/geraniol dehydrogenase (NADP+)